MTSLEFELVYLVAVFKHFSLYPPNKRKLHGGMWVTLVEYKLSGQSPNPSWSFYIFFEKVYLILERQQV